MKADGIQQRQQVQADFHSHIDPIINNATKLTKQASNGKSRPSRKVISFTLILIYGRYLIYILKCPMTVQAPRDLHILFSVKLINLSRTVIAMKCMQ